MRPPRVQLVQEQLTTLSLVYFPDPSSDAGQSSQRTQESSIRRMLPADIPRSSPATLSEPVQAAVIANPIGGIGLHLVTCQVAKTGPAIQMTGPIGNDGRHRIPPTATSGLGERFNQRFI